ncbi:MAG TPA: glycosyltransferase family 4 protein [Acidimicrobiales bacterium]|nr:glycosyltransferase family 4 protein [Acidimicrobiales bacterium]
MSERPSGRPAVILSDVPADDESPNGFSPRLLAVLRELATRTPVELIVPALRPGEERPSPAWHPAAVVDVRRSPIRGPLFKLWHYTLDRLPYMCEARRVGGLGQAILARQPRLVVIHLPYLAHVAALIPDDIPVVFAMEERWDRLYGTGPAGPATRWARRTEGKRVHRLYDGVSRRAAAIIVISEDEAERFSTVLDPALIQVVPHGVDTDRFAPSGSRNEDVDVGVFGDLTQSRNLTAALAVRRAADPPAGGAAWRWAFVGRSDAAVLSAAAPGAVVSGRVDDVRPWYERTKVVLVPATQGTGVKTTLLQAWAMGRPVVVSRFATSGAAVVDGNNALVADSPEDAVRLCRRLLDDDALRERLGRHGRETVVRHHRLADVATTFADVCLGAADRSERERAAGSP